MAAAAGGVDERSFLDGLQATAPVAGALAARLAGAAPAPAQRLRPVSPPL